MTDFFFFFRFNGDKGKKKRNDKSDFWQRKVNVDNSKECYDSDSCDPNFKFTVYSDIISKIILLQEELQHTTFYFHLYAFDCLC